MRRAMSLDDLLRQIGACRICADAARPLPHAPRPVLQASATAPDPDRGAGARRAGPCLRPALHGPLRRQAAGLAGRGRGQLLRPALLCHPADGLLLSGPRRARAADLPPRPECAPAWRAPLMREMPQIDLILCLGAHAMRWHMGAAFGGSVDEAVRNWRMGLAPEPAGHPAAASLLAQQRLAEAEPMVFGRASARTAAARAPASCPRRLKSTGIAD